MEKKGIFKDFKSEPVKVTGSTTVSHQLRTTLGLTADEYCFMEYMSILKSKLMLFDMSALERSIGYNPNEQAYLFNNLLKSGFLLPFQPGDIPAISKKWEVTDDPQREFDQLWYGLDEKGKRHAAWPGSKKDAFTKFKAIRKKYSLEHLLECRREYFTFLNLTAKHEGFNRTKMGLPVWLNPVNERFNEPWKDLSQQILDKFEPKKAPVEPITMKQMKEAYDK